MRLMRSLNQPPLLPSSNLLPTRMLLLQRNSFVLVGLLWGQVQHTKRTLCASKRERECMDMKNVYGNEISIVCYTAIMAVGEKFSKEFSDFCFAVIFILFYLWWFVEVLTVWMFAFSWSIGQNDAEQNGDIRRTVGCWIKLYMYLISFKLCSLMDETISFFYK